MGLGPQFSSRMIGFLECTRPWIQFPVSLKKKKNASTKLSPKLPRSSKAFISLGLDSFLVCLGTRNTGSIFSVCIWGGRPSEAGLYQMAVIQFSPNEMTLLSMGIASGEQPLATCYLPWFQASMYHELFLPPHQRRPPQKQCQDPAPTISL